MCIRKEKQANASKRATRPSPCLAPDLPIFPMIASVWRAATRLRPLLDEPERSSWVRPGLSGSASSSEAGGSSTLVRLSVASLRLLPPPSAMRNQCLGPDCPSSSAGRPLEGLASSPPGVPPPQDLWGPSTPPRPTQEPVCLGAGHAGPDPGSSQDWDRPLVIGLGDRRCSRHFPLPPGLFFPPALLRGLGLPSIAGLAASTPRLGVHPGRGHPGAVRAAGASFLDVARPTSLGATPGFAGAELRLAGWPH